MRKKHRFPAWDARRLGQFMEDAPDAPVPEPDPEPTLEDGAVEPAPDAPEVVEPVADPEPDPVLAAGDPPEDLGDDRWHAIIFVEGVVTNDGRAAAPGSMMTRPTPLPLMFMTTKSAMGGHDGAVLGGSIEKIMRDPALAQELADGGFLSLADGAILLVAEGSYTDDEDGQHLRQLVNSQKLRFVSADTEILEAEEVYPLEGYGDGFIRIVRGNVMGATVCPFPAFQQCVIAPMSMSLFEAATQGFEQQQPQAISTDPSPVAIAAAGGPAVPSSTWFENPRFGASDREDFRLVEDPDHPGKFYCPLTITPDGRIFGHAAAWHRDHIGYAGRSLKPPKSSTNYAYFCTGTVVVVRPDGAEDVIRCGVLTMDTGHAPTSGPGATAAAAKRHYDDTGTQVAQIEMGEDRHGIWFAGALMADVSDEALRALRAGGVSGDWRPQGAGSEMCALLACNVPGFPLPRPQRSYAIEGDEERDLALVAAGFVPPRDPIMDMVHAAVAAQIGPMRQQLEELNELATPILLERALARLDP